jgi:S1-C subfamily serine protease
MNAAPELPEFNVLTQLSASLAAVVAAAAPSVLQVHSHRAMSAGLIVTADEALADEGEIVVTLAGGARVAATIAGRDPTTDVALLRADTQGAPALALDGTPPEAGALVIAVGSQEGAPMAAMGVTAISGPAWRSMRGGEIDARIELDLSLRRHAEGGPALDSRGQAFGMAVFGPRRRVLVIPGATIARVAAQLEASGKVTRGYLGLGLQPVRLDQDGGVGAMVISVDADGPGAKAGIYQGDIIAAWNGQPIVSLGAMLRALGPATPGTSVTLMIRRGADTRGVDVTIGERP